MNALTSPAITEINATQAAFTLLAEWLRGWFNGSLHCIGASAPVQFPAVNIAFGQSDPMQPLYSPKDGLDAEIRVVAFPRSETQESLDTVLFSGKLATDYILLNFWVSAKHPGGGQSEYSAMRIADLLKAILTNPDARYPLIAGGINTLRPQLPQVIPSTDYHKRLVACAAQLQYAIQFDEQPVAPDNSVPETPLAAWNQSLEFFNEDPLIAGNYLLGTYGSPAKFTLQTATVSCWPSQNTPVVLQLEVNGALVGPQLTIPTGTANADLQASVVMGNYAINPGDVLRWKVISAPAAEFSAWHLSLELQATPVFS
jgi:hypothetical protein